MKLTLDPGAAALLDALHAAGYAAYAVGGCVRDSLLGRTAHDWDLCTSALPQQGMELFGTEQCIPTGLQHGTVTIKYGGQLYETTTFRTEGSYTDGRHPDAVQFVPDVREDLARRDFTINAMAYNEAEGLVDPFGGQADLQNGLLRAVGEPQQRFTEDALRILRLYRFAARFGFALDAATARAARQLALHLDCISAERIQEELAKLLADKLYVFALTITEEDARKRFIDRVRKLQLRKNRETMLKDAMSVYPISMQAFDRNKYFFNCKNGTLDMRTLEFREHRPEDYLTMESGITYDPDADCPRWHSFIKEVMCGDADLADFLQRSLGYALTGDTSQECMFILYGATSRNGKGTAMETFLKIMGDYGKTSNPDMLAAKFRGGNTGGPSEEVARLVGSRFVNISEPEKKITFNAALVKRMTGNDTINARFLNENSFDFVPVLKIFINTNYLPNVNDMTLFQSGRLKIIPFNRHFEEGEQDQGLKGQFAKPENLSGIFNWCLEGYKKFCQRGLELPQAVTKATEDYKDDSDRIGQFIEAWLEKEDGSELRTAAAYQLYTKWCEENGYSSENQKNFKNAIGVHFKVVRKRPKGGGGQTTLIMDCRFKEVENGAEDLTVQDAYKPKDSLL